MAGIQLLTFVETRQRYKRIAQTHRTWRAVHEGEETETEGEEEGEGGGSSSDVGGGNKRSESAPRAVSASRALQGGWGRRAAQPAQTAPSSPLRGM
eukprot:1138580-Pyramimonas_sp.AAC.1